MRANKDRNADYKRSLIVAILAVIGASAKYRERVFPDPDGFVSKFLEHRETTRGEIDSNPS
jgi:hypothetical protein